MAKVDYLIKLDDDGNRGETHDAVFMTAEEIADYQAKGFIAVSTADYQNLLGNNDEHQLYIRQKDGTFIPKPAYVPTAEEVQVAFLVERCIMDIKKNIVGKRYGRLIVTKELCNGYVMRHCDCGKDKKN